MNTWIWPCSFISLQLQSWQFLVGWLDCQQDYTKTIEWNTTKFGNGSLPGMDPMNLWCGSSWRDGPTSFSLTLFNIFWHSCLFLKIWCMTNPMSLMGGLQFWAIKGDWVWYGIGLWLYYRGLLGLGGGSTECRCSWTCYCFLLLLGM